MPVTDEDIFNIELLGVAGDTLLHRHVCALVAEVRRLRHELADPNYLYVGRIHRQAIVFRDAEIDRLRAEVEILRKEGGAMER